MISSLRVSGLCTLLLLAGWCCPVPAMDPPDAKSALEQAPDADDPGPEGVASHMAKVCASDLRKELAVTFSAEALELLKEPLEFIATERRKAAELYAQQCELLGRLRDLPGDTRELMRTEAHLRNLFRRECNFLIPMAEMTFHAELKVLNNGGGQRTAKAQRQLVRELRAICLGLATGWDQVANWTPWSCWRTACDQERPAPLQDLLVNWLLAPGLTLPFYVEKLPDGDAGACLGRTLVHPLMGNLAFADAERREAKAALRAGIPLAWLERPGDPPSPAPAPPAPAPQAAKPDAKVREAKRKERMKQQQEQEKRNHEKNLRKREEARVREAAKKAAQLALREAELAEEARRRQQSMKDLARNEEARKSKALAAAPASGSGPAPELAPGKKSIRQKAGKVRPAEPSQRDPAQVDQEPKAPAAVPPAGPGLVPNLSALPLAPEPGETLEAYRASGRYETAFLALQVHPERFAAWQDNLLAWALWGRRPEAVRSGSGRDPKPGKGAARDMRVEPKPEPPLAGPG